MMVFSFFLCSLSAQIQAQLVTIDTVGGYSIDEYEICIGRYYIYKSSSIADKNFNKTRFYSDRSLNIDNLKKNSNVVPKVNRLYQRLLKRKSITYGFFKKLYKNVSPPIKNSVTLNIQDSFITDITNDNGFNRLLKSDYLYFEEKDTSIYPSKLYMILNVKLVVFHCKNFNYNNLFDINDNMYISGSEGWCFYQKINSDVNDFYLLYDSLDIHGINNENLSGADLRLKKYKENTFWIEVFE
jgi:hypothetical protein